MADAGEDAALARFEELCAVQAVYDAVTVEDHVSRVTTAVASGDTQRAAALCAPLRASSLHVVAQLARNNAECTVTLQVPPSYPLAALEVCVLSQQLPRTWVDSVQQMLQQQAQEAARQGVQCMHELLDIALEAASSAASEQPLQAAAAASGSGVCKAAEVMLELCVVRIDHMRDRRAYSRRLRGWSEELGLAGALVFFKQNIVLVLEGAASSVRAFIQRARSCVVDVDSRGRKCRERQMDVVQQLAQPRATLTGFREVQVQTWAELLKAVEAAGAPESTWRAAVRLPDS